MKLTKLYISIGAALIALAFFLKFFNLDYSTSEFTQGFCLGLGFVLIVGGLFMRKKLRN